MAKSSNRMRMPDSFRVNQPTLSKNMWMGSLQQPTVELALPFPVRLGGQHRWPSPHWPSPPRCYRSAFPSSCALIMCSDGRCSAERDSRCSPPPPRTTCLLWCRRWESGNICVWREQ
uniref:Uncharacterized protein n=1 Tax=Anabas testudineus TaxID=64144 RepID=A0A7N6BCY1_ANATE